MTIRYDLAIIGGGTGGYTAAIRAAKQGLKVVLIEKEKLGGACLHKGCIPTKAMLESSHLYHRMCHAAEWGVELSKQPEFSVAKMMERKNKIVQQLFQGIQLLMKKNKVAVEQGVGRIAEKSVDGFTLEIAKENRFEKIEASKVIIATGSTPFIPASIGLIENRIVTSDQVMELQTKPNSVAILGGGVIGVEFATVFREIGSQVTVIEQQEHILPLEDLEISHEIKRMFSKQDIKSLLGAQADLSRVEVSGEGVKVPVRMLKNNEETTIQADLLLIAVGRKNVLQGLGLEQLGVDTFKGYIPVTPYMETSVPGIYAIGDISGSYQLAHVAAHQGVIAVDHMSGMETEPYREELIPRCVYAHPQVASIGLTEQQAKAHGYQVKIGKFSFKGIGRALIHDESDGFAKLVCDQETGRILGVHIIGKEASELIGEFSLGMLLQATAWEVSVAVHPHPTLIEIFGEAALAVEGMELNG